ncbi:MAG: hypothetical protein JNM17_03720 [Archangium sp.]|nr:hypothetical protein [Archangium sp.]
MLTALTLAMVLSGAPDAGVAGARKKQPPPGPGPTAAETAKLYFLAGDIAKAQEWVQRGLKREPKACGPLNALIAEYAFLANHIDDFTPEQAKTFLETDKKISPTVRGKLTEKAYTKWVSHPLEIAKSWSSGGNASGALQILERILIIEPTNAEALALQKSLRAPDAGR